MPCKSFIFDTIPYETRECDTPTYSIEEIENYLLKYFKNVKTIKQEVISICIDDKHDGNTVAVSTYNLNDNISYVNENDNINLSLQINTFKQKDSPLLKIINFYLREYRLELTELSPKDWFIENFYSRLKDDYEDDFELYFRGKLKDKTFFQSGTKKIKNELFYIDSNTIIKDTCSELNITQKELAEKIGAKEGTVRNWSSSNDLPEWAIKFIELLKENEKNKKIASKFKELINLVNSC